MQAVVRPVVLGCSVANSEKHVPRSLFGTNRHFAGARARSELGQPVAPLGDAALEQREPLARATRPPTHCGGRPHSRIGPLTAEGGTHAALGDGPLDTLRTLNPAAAFRANG